MSWTEIIKDLSTKEEHCLESLIRNGHDNCFTRKTFRETIKDGFSIFCIHSVIKKLRKRNLCYKIPKDIFSILWGWLYEPEFEIIAAWSMYCTGRNI